MKKQKSGVSLIVLVITIIVIIILAVAVILSIANNNPIENANKAKFKSDLKTMQEELELIKSSNYVDNNGTGYGEIAITDLKSSSNYTDDFEIQDGILYIKNDSKLTESEKEWAAEQGVTKAPITFGRADKTKALAIKSEITTSNGEEFYVIGGDTVGTEITESTQDILLLAKYNLKEEDDGTLKQDTTGANNGCAFSSINYWSSATDDEKADLNKISIPEGVTSIITTAKKYGESLNVEGRLMTYKETKVLQTHYNDILSSDPLTYWLASTFGTSSGVWDKGSARVGLKNGNYGFAYSATCGVRPVIKVSKSLVQ